MGFLLGAFGKLAAGSRYRSLQSQMMRIQSKLRRATKQASEMEKQLENQKKMALNNLSYQKNVADMMINSSALSELGISQELINKFTGSGGATTSLTDDERIQYGEYQNYLTNARSMNEMRISYAKQQIENQFDSMKEIMLEPLKQEEEALQLEKDSLESQIQLAKADYDACKDMEKDGAKDIKPQYTAQA